MKIDLKKAIYPQVKDLPPHEYKKITETILLKEKDEYDYESIKLYNSRLMNVCTKSSLTMCYIFWFSILLYCFYSQWTIPSISIKNSIFFIVGMLKWFNFSHYFHKKIHGSPEQFVGFWRWWHFNGHGYHHICPYDYNHIVIHPWIASVAIVPTFIIVSILQYVNVVSNNFVSLFMTGLIFGHMYIETSHYSMHYKTSLTPYLKKLKYHHMSHHLKAPNRKFAYFHPIEDKIKQTN